MSYRSLVPKRGDILHINFSPSAGHEMADRHYAIVLSSNAYNKTRSAIVCVVTSRVRGWPWEVPLPAGLLPPKRGAGAVESVILADQVRNVDYREREAEFIATAPTELVEEVLDRLFAVLEEGE